MFKNRADAGDALAGTVDLMMTRPYIIAAIPRGGVMVALPIAERLAVPLAVTYARKLTAPRAPEVAFGALDEDGRVLIAQSTVAALGLGPGDIEEAKARVSAEIERRMALYRVPPLARALPGPGVVLVDDGLATGLTLQAAIAYARRHGAREIAVAVPCASADAARRIGQMVDHFASLVIDKEFTAVGHYYAEFPPVRDDEVVAMLARAAEHVPDLADGPTRTAQLSRRDRASRADERPA